MQNINTALASTSVPQITALAPLVLGCADGWGSTADGKYLEKRRGANNVPWLRRKFQLYTASKASVLAQQKGSTFEKWISPYDEDYRCGRWRALRPWALVGERSSRAACI